MRGSPDSSSAAPPAPCPGSLHGRRRQRRKSGRCRADTGRYIRSNCRRVSFSDPFGLCPVCDIADVGFFLYSAGKALFNPTRANIRDAAIDAAGLLPIVPSAGMARKAAGLFNAAGDAGSGGRRLLPFGDADRITEVNNALDRLEGGVRKYAQDGTVFRNQQGKLPGKEAGYYREYTVDTPGAGNRGARRIVQGRNGETYYSDDHYGNFTQIDPRKR
jgi:guanyl-specific ribonuclease Sa